MIISITGYKGSGKNTVGDILQKNLCGNYKLLAFAQPIKDACKAIFGWDNSYFEGIKKETIDPYWGVSPRQMLQWIGTDVFQYSALSGFPVFAKTTGREIWARRLVKKIKEKKMGNVIITDWRFPHEREALIKEFDRDQLLFVKVSSPRVVAIDGHESEKYVDNMTWDRGIDNDGTIEELEEKVLEMLYGVVEK